MLEGLLDIPAAWQQYFMFTLLPLIGVVYWYCSQRSSATFHDRVNSTGAVKTACGVTNDWPPIITPLPGITPETLKNLLPIPWRPYKPTKYHMTMGIASLNPSEWIQIDRNYLERIALRKRLVEKYPEVTRGCRPEMVEAVEELYEYLLEHYLPRRWPGLFRIAKRKTEAGLEEWFENLVTGASHPLIPPTKAYPNDSPKRTKAAEDLLVAICTTVEEDMLCLLVDSALPSGTGQYVLRAFDLCFPSGINGPGIMGKPLAAIHKPVPGYKQILQVGMDRFFPKIVVGKPWRRWNWTVTAHSDLFEPGGHREVYEKESLFKSTNAADFDPTKANLRVEYQTLTRLPRSQAIIFTVRTYLTSLEDIRDNPPPLHAGTEARPEPGYGTPSGSGGADDLAAAIEGLDEDMKEYKRFHIWGPKVLEYLKARQIDINEETEKGRRV